MRKVKLGPLRFRAGSIRSQPLEKSHGIQNNKMEKKVHQGVCTAQEFRNVPLDTNFFEKAKQLLLICDGPHYYFLWRVVFSFPKSLYKVYYGMGIIVPYLMLGQTFSRFIRTPGWLSPVVLSLYATPYFG